MPVHTVGDQPGSLHLGARLDGATSTARSSVRAHKERVEKILAENLESITTEAEALELAEHFSFLLEGAVAGSGLEGTPARLEHARVIASRVLAAL